MVKTPTTPPGTPPESPTLAYTTAAADTTAHRREELMLEDGSSSDPLSHHNKVKEMFRMKVSSLIDEARCHAILADAVTRYFS